MGKSKSTKYLIISDDAKPMAIKEHLENSIRIEAGLHVPGVNIYPLI